MQIYDVTDAKHNGRRTARAVPGVGETAHPVAILHDYPHVDSVEIADESGNILFCLDREQVKPEYL